MDIYLIKNNVNAGPYSESEVMSRVKDGRYTATDLAWFAGCETPMPLIDILCKPSAIEAPPPKPTIPMPVTTKAAPKGEAFSAGDLRLIAKNYTTLFVLAILVAVGLFIPMADSIEKVWDLVLTGFWLQAGWRLSKGLHRRPWVWVIWSFIPLANIYALVRILCTAARTLKANGVPINWLVVDQATLARLAQAEKNAPQV